ncbi:hypothetical protein [Pelomonas sp. KK5]|uniref:hypothetical protein n=1 Tax=Pelomonas sp. KK5 TaxID=1855730 RepID=UPI00117F5376|nr:hypothetical protein [Pelomonas sp. KK5]
MLLVLSTLPLFVGCASFRAGFNEAASKEASEQYESVDRHSSYPVIRRNNFEQVNLLEMVDPTLQSARNGVTSWDDSSKINYGRQYDLTFAWFRTDAGRTDEQKALVRDGVQDKILAVSTSRCNVFKTFLRRQQTDVNFTLGALTTVTGVLGALLPGPRAASNLAGTAGIFSGIQAEYNQSYFSNLAAHVIVQAIELRQNRLKKELMDGRKGKSIKDYSLEAAINDAIVIDGNCSALAGLMEAQDSIKEVETPGLAMAARAMTSAKALQELAAKPVSERQADGSLDKLLAAAGANVPSLLVTSGKPAASDGLGLEVLGATGLADALTKYVGQQADTVGAAFARNRKAALAAGQTSVLDADAVSKRFKALALGKLGLDGTGTGEPFKTCAAQVTSTASSLAARMSELATTQGNDAEISKATNARDVAAARVKLTLAQVTAVKAEAQAQVSTAAAAAITGLPTSAAGIATLTDAQLTTTFNGLPAVSAAGIRASCS